MKVKLLVFAAALFMLTSLSFGQNFVACIYDDCHQLRFGPSPTDTTLPDGTAGVIYYDANSDGFDCAHPDADSPATVCNHPLDCPDGPPGTVNFNTFLLNSVDMGLDPGEFLMDPCFTSSGITPSPARYYIVITIPTGHPFAGYKWVSSVMTFNVGPQDVDLCTGWTWCAPIVTIPIIPPADNRTATIDRAGHGTGHFTCIDSCITLTHAYPTVHVCIGAGLHSNNIPHVTATGSGTCANGYVAAGFTWNSNCTSPDPWVFNASTGSFCQDITLPTGGTEGGVVLCLDSILAVQMGNIAILPLDNSVSVKFTTLSETNVSKFEIRRDNQPIARLNATNSATGHDYSYVDASAQNGTTYTYSLVVVNTDGSSEVVATQAVTPSMDKAIVTEYALHQNFPNPFNPTTSIRFDLVERNLVTLKIYNANGQEVATLVNGERNAGVNVVSFDATNLTSGLYFYTVKIGNVYSATKKMLLLK